MAHNPYGAISAFWGEELSSELIQRIIRAPTEHLFEFRMGYPDSGFSDLPTLPSGHLRPVITTSTPDLLSGSLPITTVVPSLLLYVHEAILEDPTPALLSIDRSDDMDRSQLAHVLGLLLALQPLYKAGALHFRPVTSAKRHPSAAGYVSDALETVDTLTVEDDGLLQRTLRLSAGPTEQVRHSVLGGHLTDIDAVRRMLAEDIATYATNERRFGRAAHPLFRTRPEADAVRLIGARTNIRHQHLSTMSTLVVPSFEAAARDLVAVRSDSALFAEWRDALQAALDRTSSVDLDQLDRSQVETELAEELAPFRERMIRDSQKSSFLASAIVGAKELGVGVVTGAAGFMAGGSLAVAIASGAAGSGVKGLRDYVASRAEADSKLAASRLATSWMDSGYR